MIALVPIGAATSTVTFLPNSALTSPLSTAVVLLHCRDNSLAFCERPQRLSEEGANQPLWDYAWHTFASPVVGLKAISARPAPVQTTILSRRASG